MNRPARFTIADVRRAGRAAEQLGPDWHVEITPDGTIRVVRLRNSELAQPPNEPEKVTILF